MATTYFAFTYPYSYNELQNSLEAIDKKFPEVSSGNDDDIYYCRECVCYSLEKRRVDLLTITSRHGITNQREETLKNLFPEEKERPFKFSNKKVNLNQIFSNPYMLQSKYGKYFIRYLLTVST